MTIDPKTPSFRIHQANTKFYDFFGLPVEIPKGFKWIGMDSDGEVYVYRKKPNTSRTFFGGTCEKVAAVVKYTGNWQDSLVKIKDLPKIRTQVRKD